jgi:hypothetical protein
MMFHRFAAVVTVLALATFAAAEDPKITSLQLQNAIRDTLRDELNKAYETVGTRDPKWDATVKQFLDGIAERDALLAMPATFPDPAPPTLTSLIALADKAQADGCTDPLIAHLAIVLRSEVGNSPEAVRNQGRDVTTQLLKLKLSPSLRMRLIVNMRRPGSLVRATEGRDTPATLIEYLQAPKTSLEKRVCLAILAYRLRPVIGYADSVATQLSKDTKTDPLMRHTVIGCCDMISAESMVPDPGEAMRPTSAKLFQAAIDRGRTNLTSAAALDATMPEPATWMIRLARLDGQRVGEEPRKWFDAAIAAQVDYLPAWKEYAIAIDPDHAGSFDKMFELGKQALETKRFDTAVPAQLLAIMQSAATGKGRDSSQLRKPGVWNAISACFDGYMAQATPAQKKSLQSQKAAFAFLAGEYATAQKLLGELKADVDTVAFSKLGLDAREMADVVQLLSTAAVTKDAENALAAERAGESTKAANLWSTVLTRLGPTDKSRPFVQARLKVGRLSDSLKAGKTVTLTFNEHDGLAGWMGDKANWKVLPGGILACTSNVPVESNIHLPGVFPRERNIQFEFNVIPGPKGEMPVIRLDYADDGNGHPSGIMLDSAEAKNVMYWQPMRVGGPYFGNGIPTKIASNTWVRVVITRRAQAARFELVGEEGKIFDSLPQEFLQGAPSLGLGIKLTGAGDSVQFRSITVQPLK